MSLRPALAASSSPRSTLAVAAVLALALGAALAGGCMTSPTNGTTVAGTVVGKQLTFSGYYNMAAAVIQLQVMTDPTLDPGLASSWVGFATATTSTSPTYVNSTDPLYYWSVTAAPVPTAAVASRWPQGGLVRVRGTSSSSGSTIHLITFDEVSFGDCLGKHLVDGADWSTIGLECAGTGDNEAALVSISNIPVPPGGPGAFSSSGFLGRKGQISVAETLEYYTTTNAPTTLAGFKSRYGFPTGEVTATYYNNGDLGLGREMHCKTYLVAAFPPRIGVACYVSNYSGAFDAAGNGIAAFNVNPTTVLADAVTRQHSFATVAMTYEPPNGPNAVKFVVFNASGNRVSTAQLDSTANNVSIPNNCMACHGINSAYNSVANSVSADARFLPFDPFSFKFSTAAGFTFADQADAFRRLNELIKLTNPTPAIAGFIDGMYAPKPVSDATAVANDTFVPSAWETSGSLDGHAVYEGVVKVACRTCHMSAVLPGYDFADYSDFSGLISTIKNDACGSHVMPHAERVLKNFWESGARAYLIMAFPSTSYPDPLAACRP